MADSDDLLDALGALAREEAARAPSDPRWDGLAAGTLSADARAALEAEAGGSDQWHAFMPFDAAARARITDAALAALHAPAPGDEAVVEADDAAEIGPGGGAPAGDGAASADAPGRVLPFRPRRRIAVVAAVLALAAGALIWVATRPAAVLPRYEAVVSGGVAVFRDRPAEGAPRLQPRTRLSIALVPTDPVTGEVEVRAAVLDGSSAAPWSPPVRRSGEGALRIEGAAADLGLMAFGSGPRVLRVVFGRPGSLPAVDGETPPSGPGWQALDVSVDLAP